MIEEMGILFAGFIIIFFRPQYDLQGLPLYLGDGKAFVFQECISVDFFRSESHLRLF